MSKTVIIYWSGTGNTRTMAEAVFDGAKSVNADTDCFEVSEISAEKAIMYDTLIFGCPAMGAEELEECEFEPFFAELEPNLAEKNVALFGSYGWGDGEWMRTWEKRVCDAGASLIGNEGVISNEMPSDDDLDKCTLLGKTAAGI